MEEHGLAEEIEHLSKVLKRETEACDKYGNMMARLLGERSAQMSPKRNTGENMSPKLQKQAEQFFYSPIREREVRATCRRNQCPAHNPNSGYTGRAVSPLRGLGAKSVSPKRKKKKLHSEPVMPLMHTPPPLPPALSPLGEDTPPDSPPSVAVLTPPDLLVVDEITNAEEWSQSDPDSPSLLSEPRSEVQEDDSTLTPLTPATPPTQAVLHDEHVARDFLQDTACVTLESFAPQAAFLHRYAVLTENCNRERSMLCEWWESELGHIAHGFQATASAWDTLTKTSIRDVVITEAACKVEACYYRGRDKISCEEAAERNDMVIGFGAGRKWVEQRELVMATEETARALIGRVQFVALENCLREMRAFKASQATLSVNAGTLGSHECYARKDIKNFETLLRNTLLQQLNRDLKRSCTLAFHESVQNLYNQEALHFRVLLQDMHSSLHHVAALKDDFYVLKAQQRKARQEVEQRYWLETNELMRGFTNSNELVLLIEQAKHANDREERMSRAHVEHEFNLKMKRIIILWEQSIHAMQFTARKKQDLEKEECTTREKLFASWMEGANGVLTTFLLQDYWRVRSEVTCEMNTASMELVGLLGKLNTRQAALLDALSIIESSEDIDRDAIENAELEGRLEIEEVNELFSQRFSASHAMKMLVTVESKERRSLEWHEVALRNALIQYNSNGRGAIEDRRRTTATSEKIMQMESGNTPGERGAAMLLGSSSPEPRAQTGEMEGLIDRLGGVTSKLRSHVSQIPEASPGDPGNTWPPFKIIKELHTIYSQDMTLPQLSSDLQAVIQTVVGQGYLSKDNDMCISHLSANMLQQMNAVDQEIATNAAGSFHRVYALLSMLVR